MQVCTSLQTDNHASTPPLSFLQAGCPSCRPTNSEGNCMNYYYFTSAVATAEFNQLTASSLASCRIVRPSSDKSVDKSSLDGPWSEGLHSQIVDFVSPHLTTGDKSNQMGCCDESRWKHQHELASLDGCLICTVAWVTRRSWALVHTLTTTLALQLQPATET